MRTFIFHIVHTEGHRKTASEKRWCFPNRDRAEAWMRELGKMPRVHSVGFFEAPRPIWE